MKKHFCDQCGQEITRRFARIDINKRAIWIDALDQASTDYKHFDICLKCQIGAMCKTLDMTDKQYLELHVEDLDD